MEEGENLKRKESEKGRKLHKLANDEIEHGDINEGLHLCDEAAAAYEKDKDYLGQAEALAQKVIGYRHLARKSRNNDFLMLAEGTAKEAVRVSEKAGLEASTLPLFNLAMVQEELGEFKEAVQNYRKAAERPLPIRHNNPAYRANMQVNLAACEYKTSDKDALVRAEEWLGKLEAAEHPDKYEYDVWLSGGHMRIADAIYKDNPQKAGKHLEAARGIIDSNPQLNLRREQFTELTRKIKS